MSLVTLADAKASRLAEIAQTCTSSSDFLSLVNDATRILMKRGNFWGTVQKIRLCTYNGCITWPRYVGTVLATNLCRHPIPVWNNWFQFEPLISTDFSRDGFSFNCGSLCIGNVLTENDGVTPVFNQVPCGSSNVIRIFPSVRADIGKQVTLYGIDQNGQTMRSRNASGIWQEGVTVTLALPSVDTPAFQSISRISKPVTQGVVRYFQVDAVNNVLLDLVSHDPTETNPMYRHSKIQGMRLPTACNTSSACNGLRQVDALVKLEFIPVVNDSDLVLIENLDALKSMVQSIRKKEAQQVEAAAVLEADAIHDLNLQLRDKFPNTQTPVNVMPYGTARLERQRIGTML
jgi:hypothetical protein